MRHQWDKPCDAFERHCRRCPAVIRKYAGEGGYQYWPQGLDYRDENGQVWAQWLQTIPPCEPPVLSEANRFRYGAKVRISYPTTYRYGYVRQDDGGPKIKVRWASQKEYVGGPRGPRRVLTHYPKTHEQWFPRERLEAAG
jgi:hypothetical protein